MKRFIGGALKLSNLKPSHHEIQNILTVKKKLCLVVHTHQTFRRKNISKVKNQLGLMKRFIGGALKLSNIPSNHEINNILTVKK